LGAAAAALDAPKKNGAGFAGDSVLVTTGKIAEDPRPHRSALCDLSARGVRS